MSSARQGKYLQDIVQNASSEDRDHFWLKQAEQLKWYRKPEHAISQTTRTLQSGTSFPTWTWFPGGEINTSYNCIDRHVEAGHGLQPAIIYDSPVSSCRQSINYVQLLREVETLAAVLVEECGVRRGDTVLIYMPMIPQALFAMLASSRIGAIHAVVFGGFAASALAQRIDAAEPKVVLTASCGIEGNSRILHYRDLIKGAYVKSRHKPCYTLVWEREQLEWGVLDLVHGERSWNALVHQAQKQGVTQKSVPVRSEDGLYIIYTSGTTGTPKGILRPSGGHAVGLHLSMRYIFGICGPGDVMFCASDIGWVVGHSYIVYGPLLVGATTVLFEGKPVGTPDAGTFWRVIGDYKVNVLFTAPTALRVMRRDDPSFLFFKGRGNDGKLRSLKALFLAGERSEPSIVSSYQRLLQTYCASGAQVIDNWWSSETGSPITGISTRPETSLWIPAHNNYQIRQIKPGSAGKAMPGFDVRCVNEEGNEVKPGQLGNMVLSLPLGPTAFTTLFNDEERFYRGYLKRFGGKWLDTGDAGVIDADGFVSILSREDDVINVAAHRFGTGSIEQAIVSHPDIVECCVVGIPDQLKGHLPFAFVTLSIPNHPDGTVPDDRLFAEVNKRVRDQVGSIAALGGMIQGQGVNIIPKTRSGKTLRRVLRQLVENAVHGEFDKDVVVPATVEDRAVVEAARNKVKEYFQAKGSDMHKAIEAKPNI